MSAHDRVEVDCGRLTFRDCTGLSALLAAARAAKTAGSEVRLCAVPRPLARLLRLTHAGSAFTVEHPDVQTPAPARSGLAAARSTAPAAEGHPGAWRRRCTPPCGPSFPPEP
ncbi:STAS domain-containing protein [Streptomyces puniciscabiei]